MAATARESSVADLPSAHSATDTQRAIDQGPMRAGPRRVRAGG
jgi:hypothetical protein